MRLGLGICIVRVVMSTYTQGSLPGPLLLLLGILVGVFEWGGLLL